MSPLVRRAVVAIAILRYAIPIAAIPAIPFLILQDRFALLVLLRPQKEFLLLSGSELARTGAHRPRRGRR